MWTDLYEILWVFRLCDCGKSIKFYRTLPVTKYIRFLETGLILSRGPMCTLVIFDFKVSNLAKAYSDEVCAKFPSPDTRAHVLMHNP